MNTSTTEYDYLALDNRIHRNLKRMDLVQRKAAFLAFALTLMELVRKYAHHTPEQMKFFDRYTRYLENGDFFGANELARSELYMGLGDEHRSQRVYVIAYYASTSNATAKAIAAALDVGVPKDQLDALIVLHLT